MPSYPELCLPYLSSSLRRSVLSGGVSISRSDMPGFDNDFVEWKTPFSTINASPPFRYLLLRNVLLIALPLRSISEVFLHGWQCIEVEWPSFMKRYQTATQSFSNIRNS